MSGTLSVYRALGVVTVAVEVEEMVVTMEAVEEAAMAVVTPAVPPLLTSSSVSVRARQVAAPARVRPYPPARP